MRSPIDFAFCRAQFAWTSDEEIIRWFTQPKFVDFRTFAPWFSPQDYLLENDDVRQARVNPVQHYLEFGHSEGRLVRPAPRLRKFDGAGGGGVATLSPKIAAMIHIYYAEYVTVFLDRLQPLLELGIDIYISTTQPILDRNEQDLKAALGDRLLGLHVVENRGRNFQPLLVTFAGALTEYDVICHCHSKESRYSGRRQTEWADYLISGTLGPPDAVLRHVELISSGQCAVIAPAPFKGLPPWAAHSLSNEMHLKQLSERVGLEPASGFMAYPVGGMFWMSGAVYEKLIALGLSLEDFPHEPSASDGEIHHAIERFVGQLAGEKLAFFDQVTFDYWDPSAVVKSEMRRFPPLDDLKPAIETHEVISFDFFDTLCARTTGDEEWAKKRVEQILGGDYRARRNAVEKRLRAELKAGEDVALTTISSALAALGYPDAHRATALERLWDGNTLVPIGPVAEAYIEAIESDKHVVIVSDTYYDSGLIKTFLEKHDLPQPSAIIVSCEVGARKDRGDMWPVLLRSSPGRSMLHIGDNVHSDIQNAADWGLTTFYVPHWRSQAFTLSGLARRLNERLSVNRAFAPVAMLTKEEPDDFDEFLY